MTPRKVYSHIFKIIGKLTDDGFLIYSTNTNTIEYCNEALANILHVTHNELKGMTLIQLRRIFLLDDDEFIQTLIEQLYKTFKLSNIEIRLSGDSRFISVDCYLLAKENLLCIQIKDISHIKQHIDYIVEYGARKDTLLDMVSHNLSGPLNLTNNLLNSLDELSQTQQYKKIDMHTRLIRENNQHCIEIISSFLAEEHIRSPKIFVNMNRFDVMEKINVVLERIKPFNQGKQITVVSDVSELFISSDDVKFFQIIHNLLSNSIKFTSPNGIIAIRVIDLGTTFKIAIEDDGIGIPEYLRKYIFDKNTRAGRPGLKGEKSTGLGLHIVKKLVELMNGTISFISEEDKGSTFSFTIPKIQDQPA